MWDHREVTLSISEKFISDSGIRSKDDSAELCKSKFVLTTELIELNILASFIFLNDRRFLSDLKYLKNRIGKC